MDGGFFAGEPALAHELLDEAVVLGQLFQLAALQQIGPRVADVHERQPLLVVLVHQSDGGHGRRHPLEVRVVPGQLPHRVIGFEHRADEAVDRMIVERRAEGLDGGLRGDLSCLVAAEPVSDGEERVGDQETVLVDRPHVADVGGRSVREPRHFASSMIALPTWTRSPRRTGVALATFLRLRNVPLVEPRSSTNTWPLS